MNLFCEEKIKVTKPVSGHAILGRAFILLASSQFFMTHVAGRFFGLQQIIKI
jgi:hypothetical protein